ncbi:hypothetical protein HY991_04525 [Candidatus Micrarchaeota archaeon]|nr:hypothetical protein [Candidatus Micrarchaeota archaeon]
MRELVNELKKIGFRRQNVKLVRLKTSELLVVQLHGTEEMLFQAKPLLVAFELKSGYFGTPDKLHLAIPESKNMQTQQKARFDKFVNALKTSLKIKESR